MELIVNGQPKLVPENCTAQQLIEILEITGGRIAMEVNREIVPRSTYANHTLNEGDAIEIVHAVGGGQPHAPQREFPC